MTTPQPQQKVPLYSLNDLKTTTIDSIPNILRQMPLCFGPSERHTFIRLLLGYTAVLLAAYVFFLDYRYGWGESKAFTGIACVVYFALNGALTAWVWLGEKGLIYQGTRYGSENALPGTIWIWSKATPAPAAALTAADGGRGKGLGKYDPTFSVTWAWRGNKQVEKGEAQGAFMEWFDEKGVLSEIALRTWLMRTIPPLKRVDDFYIGKPEAFQPPTGSSKKARKKG